MKSEIVISRKYVLQYDGLSHIPLGFNCLLNTVSTEKLPFDVHFWTNS